MGLSVLVVGGGGREHALAWALARSESVGQVYVAPGNAGTAWDQAADRAGSVNLPIPAEATASLLSFALDRHIDLTVIGPEVPLAKGIVDAFQSRGLRVFGPTQAAAQLEASKAFSKAFMQRHNIPTAEYGTFDNYDAARDFVEAFGRPVVVKADGLAAGKGVIVCNTTAEAEDALKRIMLDSEFGASGARVIVEERMSGTEVSALAFSDGKTVALMPFARDHKRIFDGDQGANTGGMGAYAPVPDVPPDLAEFVLENVLKPVIRGMAEEGSSYVGVLYAGLMLTQQGVKVLEFNCRFGDPETQVILPLLESDLAKVIFACTEGQLNEHLPLWSSDSCATVVLASPGYPNSYPKGIEISGLEELNENVLVFHAGTIQEKNRVVTAGGRVLAISGCGTSLAEALKLAYSGIQHVHFEGMHYRHDIGRLQEGITR
ncbi:MAG: phosphoribosylamine--glycine ligase [Chloroflexota bacterium]